MHRIEALLRKEIGLDAASIGSALIERTIRLRMKQHGLRKPEDYQALLDASRAELDELIEAVVVTETWFFRDREPFNAFIQLVLCEWLPRHPTETCRILSVPCSTGEEPYSLAMALLDGGLPDARFTIDAVDISSNALARAQRAVYGKNSFRGKDLAFRDRHFEHTKDGYALSPLVHRGVSFRRDNLLGDGFLAGGAPYDFIFCRNLMIYFDRATQMLTLGKLHRLLTPNGVLFVGPAELPLVSEGGFASANLPLAFACRKTTGGTASGLKPRRRKTPRLPPAPVSPNSPTTISTNGNGGVVSKAPVTLETARQLADAGQLGEAAAVCEAHIGNEGPSAPAYYLLALVKDAADDAEAITFYRKALYLDPDHYEALIHLALLLERTGDPGSARTFKRRAERVQPKT